MSKTGANRYFEDYAENFNSYYKESNWPLIRSAKRYLWKDLAEREIITSHLCFPFAGKNILDIGCGDGHYSKRFVHGECASYVGIDFSEEMIRQARQSFESAKNCRFIRGDFMAETFREQFHSTIAMGVLDYVKNPNVFLEKALSLSSERVVVSFPRRTLIRGTIRRIKYSLRGCPIYLYSLEQIILLLNSLSNLKAYRIIPISGIGMDFVVELMPKS